MAASVIRNSSENEDVTEATASTVQSVWWKGTCKETINLDVHRAQLKTAILW